MTLLIPLCYSACSPRASSDSATSKSVTPQRHTFTAAHQVSIRYRVTIKINPFIGGNTARRLGFLLQEDGTFYIQCHAMKCMKNPMGRNCSPGVRLLFPVSPLISIHTTGVCIIPGTKKKAWTWISHSVTENTATATTRKENIGMKASRCLVSEEAIGFISYMKEVVSQ